MFAENKLYFPIYCSRHHIAESFFIQARCIPDVMRQQCIFFILVASLPLFKKKKNIRKLLFGEILGPTPGSSVTSLRDYSLAGIGPGEAKI